MKALFNSFLFSFWKYSRSYTFWNITRSTVSISCSHKQNVKEYEAIYWFHMAVACIASCLLHDIKQFQQAITRRSIKIYPVLLSYCLCSHYVYLYPHYFHRKWNINVWTKILKLIFSSNTRILCVSIYIFRLFKSPPKVQDTTITLNSFIQKTCRSLRRVGSE